MDIKILIWLVVLVVTWIIRANKKKAAEGGASRPNADSRPDPTSKPITFEELLKEIQASKPASPSIPPPTPVSTPKSLFEDYDDDLEEEEKDLEKPDYSYRDQDKIYETYEKAKLEAFNKPSLEETMKVEDTVVKYGQFKGYQQQAEPNQLSVYLKELSDPQGFKKAFVMSEILTRRF